MGNTVRVLIVATALLLGLGSDGPLYGATPQSSGPSLARPLTARSLSAGPCQQLPPGEADRWDSVDFSAVGSVANRFDVLLGTYVSYGGTYWHRDGGLRVRIARDRADTALAQEVASNAIADTTVAVVGGLQIEPTDVSLRDLRIWASQARDGLTYIAASDVVSVSIDQLCQYVQVFVLLPATARLSAAEQSRYVVTGTASSEPPKRWMGGVR